MIGVAGSSCPSDEAIPAMIPDQVLRVLAQIRARGGQAPPGHRGGEAFRNREGRLPPGDYRKYDVYPHLAGKKRGPERLIINQQSGRVYYSRDHYVTFELVTE